MLIFVQQRASRLIYRDKKTTLAAKSHEKRFSQYLQINFQLIDPLVNQLIISRTVKPQVENIILSSVRKTNIHTHSDVRKRHGNSKKVVVFCNYNTVFGTFIRNSRRRCICVCVCVCVFVCVYVCATSFLSSAIWSRSWLMYCLESEWFSWPWISPSSFWRRLKVTVSHFLQCCKVNHLHTDGKPTMHLNLKLLRMSNLSIWTQRRSNFINPLGL